MIIFKGPKAINVIQLNGIIKLQKAVVQINVSTACFKALLNYNNVYGDYIVICCR